MGLGLSLAIASGEIATINDQFALLGHNVANASTPDFATETQSQQSVTAGGIGLGARATVTTRQINTQLQSSLFVQNGSVAAAQTTATALAPIDAAMGAPGSGSDIGSQLATLTGQFASLQSDPANATQQAQVVSASQTLAGTVNGIADAVQTARQDAQNAIVSGVQTLNATLATIGSLNRQIITAQAAGSSSADLANQRDAAIQSLSGQVSINIYQQNNGGVLLATGNGLVLPTDGTAFATSGATLGPGAYAPGGGVPAITLAGRDVTGQLTGGQLGADIALRDRTLPTLQANIDQFAQTLSARFAAQGLTLFSDAAGSVPPGGGTPAQAGYVGYAAVMQVNPAVLAQPSLVRDGTNAVAGSATGATAFTANPPGGPAGFSALIQRVLTYAVGADVQTGVTQPAPPVSGLGPAGSLSAGFTAPPDLPALAAAVTAQEAQVSSATSASLSTEQGVQSTLQSKLSSGSAVNIDTEMATMIQLQNAYEANAKVMTAVQSMWAALNQAVS